MVTKITRDADEGKPRVICPNCKEQLLADITQYAQDATKPVLSQCPYCRGEIWSCCVIIAHKDLKQLGATITTIIQAVEESADPLRPDSSGILLQGDKDKMI